MNKNHFFFPLIVLLALIVLVSCGKDDKDNNQSMIPNVPVNFYIQPNTIDFIPAGSWQAYDNEGYRGVLVYRLDQYTFMSYEMTCPYDPDQECARVMVDPNSFTLIDSCCMSRFNIIDGMPVDGPATTPLLQYFNEFDGNYLHIFNGN